MFNWSTNEKHLKKYPEKYKIWKLEQLINFGLNNEKIIEKDLRKYFDIIDIDPAKRKFLKFLLDGKKK